MTISLHDLEQDLKSKFNVKCMCDLGAVSTSLNGLFKLLDKVYQKQYEPRDRIVFYTSHVPPENLLKHLYETCNFLDISNWFVLICGPSRLAALVESTCQAYSQDPIPFKFQSVELSPTQVIENEFEMPETMCAVPWHNIEIKSNGNISPCCMNDMILGNIQEMTLDQAFTDTKMSQLRNDLLSGKQPESCNRCWRVEAKNLTSIRMHNIKRLKTDFLTKYLDQPQIAHLDIKFNNTCNFKCRICDATYSSLHAQEQHRFLGQPLLVQHNWGEDQNFIDQVVEHLPVIQNIDMYGGEPFLIKKFKTVLALAVEKNYAKGIRLHYNSNGSIWPGHLLEFWPSFKLVDIHFSIDAIGRQFELQRGGSWSEVENNILRLKDLCLPNLSISIMPTINVMNIYYIDQVYDWAIANGFPVFVSHIRNREMELQNLTSAAKKMIVEKFQNHPWDEMRKVVEIIQTLPDSDGSEFRNKIQWFDSIRKENFSDHHVEIAKAMGFD